MAIEKLDEFARDGQKNTDGLTQTDGFPVLIKPARQWFNWLFNTLTLKINEIIDEKIYYEDIIDNLTTDDATKPVSAKQAKKLQDEKLSKASNLSDLQSAATARSNLGLGNSATRDVTLNKKELNENHVMKVGDFGVGIPIHLFNANDLNSTEFQSNSMYFTSGTAITNGWTNGIFQTFNGNAGRFAQIGFLDYGNTMRVRTGFSLANGGGWATVRTTSNTTVDANGFIKNASPIVNLYADRIELNDAAQLQPIEFEKSGIGDYLLKGSTGLAQEGWYIEQPRDANGNIYHAVIYQQLENGDLSIKTYENKLDEVGRIVANLEKPIDIQSGRWISVRLNELPADSTAPVNPTIVDADGNPAPSKYHVLENGVWIISEEDNGKWQAELYAVHLASFKPLTRYQFFRALLENGYKSADIEAQIQTIANEFQRELVMLGWQNATQFIRTDESVLLMQSMLGWTDAQVEQMWTYAMTL